MTAPELTALNWEALNLLCVVLLGLGATWGVVELWR